MKLAAICYCCTSVNVIEKIRLKVAIERVLRVSESDVDRDELHGFPVGD